MPIPLLLLPGTLCDGRLWQEQRGALAAEAEILVPDLTRQAGIAELAEEVLARAPPRFVLAGFSFGGFVAQAIQARAADRVLALCLLSTGARPFPLAMAQERRTAVARARDMGVGRFLREVMMPSYLHPSRLGRADLVALIASMGESLGADAFARQTEANIARPDGRPCLASVAAPCFIACGEDDRLSPVELHRELAAGVQGSELTIVPDVGHFLPLEAPGATTDILRRALAAAGRRPPPAARSGDQ